MSISTVQKIGNAFPLLQEIHDTETAMSLKNILAIDFF